MNGADRLERRKSLKERLGLTGICFGASWGPVSIHVRDDEDPEIPPPPSRVEAGDLGQVPVASGVNLAAALASERNYLPATDASVAGDITVGSMNDRRGDVVAGTAPQTPSRVSLMRLLWETDGGDGGGSAEEEGGEVGCDSVCCVCMGRKKGAAFIPCGHTFCRLCTRELWLNRRACPICNRLILEILDIY